jgi:uncharacterized membrane protein affecting hemolysin expression
MVSYDKGMKYKGYVRMSRQMMSDNVAKWSSLPPNVTIEQVFQNLMLSCSIYGIGITTMLEGKRAKKKATANSLAHE